MTAESITQIYMPPREAVRRLVEAGVLHGLDDQKLDELRAECWDGSEEQLEEAGLLAILTFHYETLENGARDGFIWHATEFWHDTDDAVAELNACLNLPKPLFRQRDVSMSEGAALITVERDDGVQEEIEARSLADLVDAFNDALAQRRSPKRLVALDTGGRDWEMYACLELKKARLLAAEGALPVADLDSLGD